MAATITPAVGRADRIIHTAAKEGNVDRIREQIALGESFRAVDSQGRRPLHIAVIHSQVEAIKLLLELEDDSFYLTEDEFASPLHLAASTGNAQIVGLILDHYPPQIIELKDLFGRTALDLLSKGVHTDCYELILKKGGIRSFSTLFQDGISGRSYYLKPPKELPNPGLPQPAEEGVQEKALCDTLFEAFKKGDLFQQISSLTALAACCLKRGDEWRAALILNSGYSVAKDESISSECRSELMQQLEQVETAFIRHRLKSDRSYPTRIQQYRLRLHTIREVCAANLYSDLGTGGDLLSMLSLGAPNTPHSSKANLISTILSGMAVMTNDVDRKVNAILHQLNSSYKNILIDLLNESIEVMGKSPPTRYTMVSLGSLSRNEACPYSDIEFFFLTENSSEETLSYFRLLTQLMRLRVTNFGETEVKLIQTDEGAYSLTPSGFSMDIGGLSPLGKEGLYELIGTPKELARFQTEAWLRENEAEIILVNAMRTVSLITGEESLLNDYKKEIDRLLNDKGGFFSLKPRLRQKRAIELMRGCLEEFSPKLDQAKIELRAYDVKKEFYRLPQNIISLLSLYFGIQSNNTFSQISDLLKKGYLSSNNYDKLGKTLQRIFRLRLQTHLFYRSQTETLYHLRKGGEIHGKNLFFVSPKLRLEIQSIYSVLIPLQRVGIAFINGDEKAFSKFSIWDSSITKTGNKRSPNLSPSSSSSPRPPAPSSSYDPIHPAALNPNSLSSLLHLGSTQFEQSDFEKAIQTYQEALLLVKGRYGDAPHLDTARVMLNLGLSYLQAKKGEFIKGVDYTLKALSMYQLLGCPFKEREVSTLFRAGEAIRLLSLLMPSYEEGAQICDVSLSIFQTIRLENSQLETARTLAVKGALCRKHERLPEALEHYNNALSILEKLDSNEARTEMGEVFENIGKVHFLLNHFEEAKDSFESALSIYRSLYGETPRSETVNALKMLVAVDHQLNEPLRGVARMSEALLMERALLGDQATLKLATDLTQAGRVTENPERRLQLYTAALSIYQHLPQEGANKEIAKLALSLGKISIQLEQLQNGVDHLELALTHFRQIIDTPASYLSVLEDLSTTYTRLANHDRAIAYQTEVISIMRESEAPALPLSAAIEKLAASYRAIGDEEKAKALSEESIQVTTQAMGQALVKSCTHQ